MTTAFRLAVLAFGLCAVIGVSQLDVAKCGIKGRCCAAPHGVVTV